MRKLAAPGGPGIEPRWTRATKNLVGTARSAASHVWYTVAHGVVDEVYGPTIDRPQIRDLQLLVTAGETFFHDERRHLETRTEKIDQDALAVRVSNTDPEGRCWIIKEIMTDPDQSALLIRVRIEAEAAWREKLRVFVLCAPRLDIGAWGNSGRVESVGERTVLTANKGETWRALGASVPFLRASVGCVGVNDGWRDLARPPRPDLGVRCRRRRQHRADRRAGHAGSRSGGTTEPGGRAMIMPWMSSDENQREDPGNATFRPRTI